MISKPAFRNSQLWTGTLAAIILLNMVSQIVARPESPKSVENRPQQYGTGGEMALWISRDEGETWTLEKQVTEESPFNHGYARRPASAKDPFYAFWADGDPTRLTRSHLFFADSSGGQAWRLPYEMKEDFATPRKIAGEGATPLP